MRHPNDVLQARAKVKNNKYKDVCGLESQSETESQGNISAGMKSTINEFDMMSNDRVRSANWPKKMSCKHDKTLYLPLLKPEQNTTPSTEDLIELDDLIWGMNQAMLMQRVHWNAESLEIESRALIEFVKVRQGIKVHTVDSGIMNQSAEAGGEPLMLRTMPIGILEIKSQVQTLRVYGIITDEIPSWIGKLIQLENLTLDGSTHDSTENHNSVLTQLPISMGDMERLNTIALSNFIRLREITET